jgi:hypothetical protein
LGAWLTYPRALLGVIWVSNSALILTELSAHM